VTTVISKLKQINVIASKQTADANTKENLDKSKGIDIPFLIKRLS
jgi:hypothetical protein